MSSKNSTLQDFKIGLFVLITLSIATVVFFRLQSPKAENGHLINVQFGYVAGLTQGAPVSLSGVTIGEVSAVKVVKRNEMIGVDVTLLVYQPEYIQADSEFRISSKGLLGSKYVEIFPGKNALGGIDGSKNYIGSDPVLFERVLETGDRIAIKMEQTIDSVNLLITNDEFRENLQQNAENLSQLILELRQTSALMNEILGNVKDGQGTIGKLLTEDIIYQDLSAFASDIKRNPWKLFKKK